MITPVSDSHHFDLVSGWLDLNEEMIAKIRARKEGCQGHSIGQTGIAGLFFPKGRR